MAPTSCGFTMVVVYALVLLTSMLPTTTANELTRPNCSTLFPGMCNQQIYHLVHYDLVLSDRSYFPQHFPASHFCRFDGFKAIDLTSIQDLDFGISFWKQDLPGYNFFTGDRYSSGGGTRINYFDSLTGKYYNNAIENFLEPLLQLCVRQTDVNFAIMCNGLLVQKNKFTSRTYTYSEARTFCRLRQGFDLPTHRDYVMYYAHHDPKCHEFWTLHPWVQDDNVENGAAKKFICAGCHVHFNDLAGVKRIEANGTLTCKEGWYTDLPVNKHIRPRCAGGYWDINTIGRCRQTQFSLGHTKYYLYMDINMQPISSPHNTDLCHQTGGNRLGSFGPIDKHLEDKVKYLLATWGKSATAWSGINGLYISPRKEGYNVNGHYWNICKRTCEPLYNEFTQHDLATGDSYCPIANYMWTCRDDNCPRRGKATMPTCDEVEHGGKRTVWTTALCKKQDNRIQQAIATHSQYTVDFRRAEFRCAAGWYQDDADICGTGNTRCAGGPGNYPVKPEITYFHGPYSNTPICHPFAKIDLTASNVEVYVSKMEVTAEWARWVCQSAGMNVYSELFYTELPDQDKHALRTFLDGTVKQVWMINSAGHIHASNVQKTSSSSFQGEPLLKHQLEKIKFMCVKYHSYFYPFKNFVVDYAKTPEACPDGHELLKVDGFEKCSKRAT